MGLFDHWLGRATPKIVVLEGERWWELTRGTQLDRALERRKAKKLWDGPPASDPADQAKRPEIVVPEDWPYPLPPAPLTNGERAAQALPVEDGLHFYALVSRAEAKRGEAYEGLVEIESSGMVIGSVEGESAERPLNQLADANLSVAAAFAVAGLDEDGHWRVWVWL